MSTTEIPQNALRGRQMYADGAEIKPIMAETGLSKYRLYFWIDGGPMVNGKHLLDPIPRRIPRRTKVTPADRRALVARIMASSERQVDEIERRIAAKPEELDRDARTLAVIARTLNELTALDERNREMNRKRAALKNDQSRTIEQPAPQTDDEFRIDLARRIDALVASRIGAGIPDEPSA